VTLAIVPALASGTIAWSLTRDSIGS